MYAWAGQLRTVDISKAGAAFVAVEDIPEALEALAGAVAATDRLALVTEEDFPVLAARLYHIAHVAHPFRDGNGRTQRAVMDALAAESGHGLDWPQVSGARNDAACAAALGGDLDPTGGHVHRDHLPPRRPASRARRGGWG